MNNAKFMRGIGFGIAVGAAATGILISQRKTLMKSKAGRTIRSVGHTVSEAVDDIGDVFRK